MHGFFGDVAGYVAGALTTIAFVPQVVKTYRTRSAGDISLGMVVLFAAGVFLWLLYGAYVGSGPVVAANLATLILIAALVVMKIRFK